jgi:hypothetical protein
MNIKNMEIKKESQLILENNRLSLHKYKSNLNWSIRFFLISVIVIAVTTSLGSLIYKLQHLLQVPGNTVLETISNQDIFEADKSIFYKAGNKLVRLRSDNSWNDRKIILEPESGQLLDFSLSEDQNLLVYTLSADGFEGNSDIYVKSLATGGITRLTEENNIASSNPRIFPDNNKVAYVRRIYDPITKEFSSDEIWTLNINGDIESSEKLFSFDNEALIENFSSDKMLDENGNWNGQYMCVSEEDFKNPKIGINQISPDGLAMNYWKKKIAPECSGLWKSSQFSNLDGSDFLTEEFKQQNIFAFRQKSYEWTPGKIFWFEDGSFILRQSALPPIAGISTYYSNKDQNEKWMIFDSFVQNISANKIGMSIRDVVQKDNGNLIIIYGAHERLKDTKYFVEEISFGEQIDPTNLKDKEYFAIEKLSDRFDRIDDVIFLDDENFIYSQQIKMGYYGLYLYSLPSKETKEILKMNTSLIEIEI